MSNYASDSFETDSIPTPFRPGQLSSNGQWIFGSIYAGLALVGFAFGVWAGAARPKPVEVAEAKKDTGEKPAPRPVAGPPAPNPAPVVTPPVVEPKKEKEPEPKTEPEPKPKEPEPKPKEPEPKPKAKEPEPKKPERVVLFKEIEPVLRKYCNECHGASSGKPKGGIDLRTIAAINKGGNNGDILTAGEPQKSTLYTSLLPTTKGEKMPPDGKPQPTEKEIMLIHDWIAGGSKPRRTVRKRRSRGTAKMELTPGSELE